MIAKYFISLLILFVVLSLVLSASGQTDGGTEDSDPVKSIGFTTDGKYLVAGVGYSECATVWWNVQTGQRERIVLAAKGEGDVELDDMGTACLVTPNGKYFFRSLFSFLYSSETGREQSKEHMNEDAFAFKFSGDGSRAIFETDTAFTVREIPSGKIINKFPRPRSKLTPISLGVNYDGVLIADSIGKDLVIWNANTGKTVKRFVGVGGDNPETAFSQNGRFIVLRQGGVPTPPRYDQCRTIVFDLEQGKKILDLGPAILGLAISPDNKTVATLAPKSPTEYYLRGLPPTIRLLDAVTGKVLAETEIGTNKDNLWSGLQFDQSGKYLALFGPRGIKLLDGKTGKLLSDMK